MKKVIAISGWRRSGKDTLAEYLINEYNYNRIGFADPLKERVAEEFKIPVSYCYDDKYKEEPLLQYPVQPKDEFTESIINLLIDEFKSEDGYSLKELRNMFPGKMLGIPMYWTPRALCILKGSVNRAVTSDYWVKAAIDKINDPNFESNFVISDLRYRSEVDQLREAFGKNLITIRVNRFDSIDTFDPSERDLDGYKFGHVIKNTGTLEELFEKLEDILDEVEGDR